MHPTGLASPVSQAQGVAASLVVRIPHHRRTFCIRSAGCFGNPKFAEWCSGPVLVLHKSKP